MTHTTTYTTGIPNHTLSRVQNDRLQRGVEGLASGAYTITVTRCTEDEVSAFVANGDGKEYSVTLTAMRAFCGCEDSMFRGKTCKHAVAVALYAIREPAPMHVEEEVHGEDIAPQASAKAPDLTLRKVRRSTL